MKLPFEQILILITAFESSSSADFATALSLPTGYSSRFKERMEKLKKDPFNGLDSRRSWVVSGFSCWLIVMATTSVRSSGVLYVAIVDSFEGSREEASVPLTLHISAVFMGSKTPLFRGRFRAGHYTERFRSCMLTLWMNITNQFLDLSVYNLLRRFP